MPPVSCATAFTVFSGSSEPPKPMLEAISETRQLSLLGPTDAAAGRSCGVGPWGSSCSVDRMGMRNIRLGMSRIRPSMGMKRIFFRQYKGVAQAARQPPHRWKLRSSEGSTVFFMHVRKSREG